MTKGKEVELETKHEEKTKVQENERVNTQLKTEKRLGVPKKEETKWQEKDLLVPQVCIKSYSFVTPIELDSSVNIRKVGGLVRIPQFNCAYSCSEKPQELDAEVYVGGVEARTILIPSMELKSVRSLSELEIDASLEVMPAKKSIKVPQIQVKAMRILTSYEKFLDKPILVGTEEHSSIEERTVTKEDVEKAETKSKQELTGRGEGAEPGLEEDVLEEILPRGKGDWRITSLQRPLCLIVTGERADGLTMVEHLISTKFTYQGQYMFSKGLPWQERVLTEMADGQMEKTGIRYIPSRKIGKKEDPYSLITSEDLIVQISANEDDKAEIVRGLKEISKRGPKCVILYASNVKPFEDLDRRVLDVDIAIVSLPERSEKILKLVGKLLGVDLSAILEPEWKSIDELWAVAVRLYEEELKRLDKELPTEDVDYFPDRESRFHYLMKRIVYSHLKRRGYKDIRVEQPISLIDENEFVGYVIPDIVADGEYWEVETGYPSSDEKKLIIEYWSPYARLVWKLSKYKENPSKIRVVFPAIYAYLFYDEIRKIKAYFEKRGIDIKFYTIYLHGKGELRRFV